MVSLTGEFVGHVELQCRLSLVARAGDVPCSAPTTQCLLAKPLEVRVASPHDGHPSTPATAATTAAAASTATPAATVAAAAAPVECPAGADDPSPPRANVSPTTASLDDDTAGTTGAACQQAPYHQGKYYTPPPLVFARPQQSVAKHRASMHRMQPPGGDVDWHRHRDGTNRNGVDGNHDGGALLDPTHNPQRNPSDDNKRRARASGHARHATVAPHAHAAGACGVLSVLNPCHVYSLKSRQDLLIQAASSPCPQPARHSCQQCTCPHHGKQGRYVVWSQRPSVCHLDFVAS